MNAEEVARDYLEFDVELFRNKAFGPAVLYGFRTIGVWPSEYVAVISIENTLILCSDESSVIQCVDKLKRFLDAEMILDFIKLSLPFGMFVLDKNVPSSITGGIEASWDVPICGKDSLILFVNDSTTKTVSKWQISNRDVQVVRIGRGIQLLIY